MKNTTMASKEPQHPPVTSPSVGSQASTRSSHSAVPGQTEANQHLPAYKDCNDCSKWKKRCKLHCLHVRIPSSKRSKPGAACERCKSRRKRCPGYPCTSCKKLNIQCEKQKPRWKTHTFEKTCEEQATSGVQN